MRPAPDTSLQSPNRTPSGAGSGGSRLRALAATELRLAGGLRRDLAAGVLPRAAALSAARDCLRHARMCRAAALAAALALAACAQSPDAIPPVAMGDAFATLPCADARNMLAAERQTLATLEAAQRSAATGDALGVFLLGLPVSSITGGDKAGQIGASKGKVLALEARVAGCR